MNENKTWLAILICVGFYVAYTYYLQTKYPNYGKPKKPAAVVEENKPKGETGTQSPTTSVAENTAAQQQPAKVETLIAASDGNAADDGKIAKLDMKDLTIDTERVTYVFDQKYAGLRSIVLKNYKKTSEKGSPPMEMVDSLLTLQPTPGLTYPKPFEHFHAQRQGQTLTFWKQVGPWRISESFTPKEGTYGADIKLTYQNTSASSQELTAGITMTDMLRLPEPSKGLFPDFIGRYYTAVAAVEGSPDDEMLTEHCEDEEDAPALSGQDQPLDYVGIDKHYFLKMLLTGSEKYSYRIRKTGMQRGRDCQVATFAYQPYGQIGPGETVTINMGAYFGPKEVGAMAAVNDKLQSSINVWFAVIAHPLLLAVRKLHALVGNWGIAIIILTICLKLLFYPLTKAAAVSMKRMQKFQPRINEIKEKYKDDREKQQREMMAFMRDNKINPAKGCFPILPQIPVFIAFYQVLSQSIELRHAPFFGWIQDLSAADPYYITPVFLGLGMLVQQKLTPNPTMDKTQEKVMMMMPVIFTVMMLSFPAGLVLYMITNTAVSILQQQWLNKTIKVDDVKIAKPAKA